MVGNIQKLEAFVQHSSSSLLPNNTFSIDAESQVDGVLPGQEVVENRTLDLIHRLCQELSQEQITYCHWKSNNALDRSASGENDLDLLVSRADAERFNAVLYKLGFKEAFAPADRSMPGVLDFYGFDRKSSRIVHVHVHYQLMVGHDMSKNFHIQIENPYLASASQGEMFKVPAPEFEFVVLIIRMVLKHLTWETILIRHGKLSPAERAEITYLSDQVNQDHIAQILKEHLPTISSDLFAECLTALKPGASLAARISAGHKLLKALNAYARRGRFQDVILKLWRRVAWGLQRRIVKRSPKRQLANGGAMIAIVGGDGAGKTTAIDGLYDWLKNDLAVTKVHLGKPKWSLTTRLVRAFLKIGRVLGLSSFVSEADIMYTNQPDKKLNFSHYALLVRQLLRSRDRLKTYMAARQQAINGSLVICDRFPLSQIHSMDGPILPELVNPEEINKFVAWMIRMEKQNFQAIAWPELVIILKLDPQIAAERKTDEDSDYVRARSEIVWSADWQGTPAHVVDASQEREVVLAKLKSLVWSAI